MKISSFLISIFSLSAMVMFNGCVSSSYAKFYQENQQITPFLSSGKNNVGFLADGEEPKIIATDDLQRDTKVMFSRRFVPIGGSSFNGEMENADAVRTQAKKIKAVLALYTSKYTDTQTNSGTLLIPQTNYYSGTANAYNGYGSGYATYNGTSTTTVAMPYSKTQRRFDQNAVFFVKDLRPMKFGINALEIPREKRIEIGRSGMLVNTIYEDTPAYKSNMMVGDIIIEVNGNQVEDKKGFDEFMKAFDVSKGFCDFKILRNGAEQLIRIKFL